MRYIDVEWIHGTKDYPIRLISEIDDEQYEIRKLELFSNGKVGFATKTDQNQGALLGTGKVPAIKEINKQKEFEGNEITKIQFEELWQKHVPSRS